MRSTIRSLSMADTGEANGLGDAQAGSVAGGQDGAMLAGLPGLTASRYWTTSCGLSTPGSDCGFFGAGITSSKGTASEA